jgi:UDP-N-acetylmuramate dehydrogenase
MLQQVEKNKQLAPLTTFSIGGTAGGYMSVSSIADLHELPEVLAAHADKELVILGGGSNIIFPNEAGNLLVVHINVRGRHIEETDEEVRVTIGAGENWDEIVAWCVERGYAGIESLSGIPGSVGGAIVQNIGAYGSEIEERVIDVEVYDSETGTVRKFSHEECVFVYRESVFKKQKEFRYIVLGCTLRLYRIGASDVIMPEYSGVLSMYEQLGFEEVTLQSVRETIIALRNSKLPNPENTPNVGSFFKNPIISQEVYALIENQLPDAPHWESGQGIKLSAGWLIDRVGMKGKWFGGIQVSPKHALVLTNPSGGATFADVMDAKGAIIEKVQKEFGITLEEEPVIIAI